MAAEVAATFTPTQLEDYGNIILNGYLESVPNTTNKKAWQYQETATAPINLPSLSQVTPVLKGWTTNYQEYYTQLQPNGYNVNPGDPTMFAYSAHSYTVASTIVAGAITTTGTVVPGSAYTPGTYTGLTLTGGTGTGATGTVVVAAGGPAGNITTTGTIVPGSAYTPGTYTAVPLTGGTGTGATGTVVVSAGSGGAITSFTSLVGGTGYTPGTYLNVPLTGGTGTGASANIIVTQTGGVTAVSIISPGNDYGLSGFRANYPTQAVTGTGTGLRVSYNYSANALTSITAITAGGSGYVVGDTATVDNAVFGVIGGNGVIRVDAYTTPGPGPVTSATPVVGSTGYTVGDVLTAVIPGGGTGWSTTVATVSGGGGGGTVASFTLNNAGTGYTVGDSLSAVIPAGSGWSVPVTGVGAGGGGTVSSFTLGNPGSGYTVGDSLTAVVPGGSGWSVPVTAVTPAPPPVTPGEPRWAQAPRRFFQNQVADFVPPTANQQAIQYSFLYPAGDNTTQPPIGSL
jgi:hypothetical protein